jgi:hypothetical protein
MQELSGLLSGQLIAQPTLADAGCVGTMDSAAIASPMRKLVLILEKISVAHCRCKPAPGRTAAGRLSCRRGAV